MVERRLRIREEADVSNRATTPGSRRSLAQLKALGWRRNPVSLAAVGYPIRRLPGSPSREDGGGPSIKTLAQRDNRVDTPGCGCGRASLFYAHEFLGPGSRTGERGWGWGWGDPGRGVSQSYLNLSCANLLKTVALNIRNCGEPEPQFRDPRQRWGRVGCDCTVASIGFAQTVIARW